VNVAGRVLKSSDFAGLKSLVVYRLARTRYANLSGIGASLFPGRWNVAGQHAIYTSTVKALTVLETLVHLGDKRVIPSGLAMMTIEIKGNWNLQDQSIVDESTGGSILAYETVPQAQAQFDPEVNGFGGPYFFAVCVPSVIVNVSNIVLYPESIGFWNHVSLVNVEPFSYDPRLFPEEASVFEAAETTDISTPSSTP
jgi:RES domain-containing protein